MTDKQIPDETFPVGEYIADELAARKWSNSGLASRTGMSRGKIADIIAGKRKILARDAEAIGRAFGTSAELWLRLQKAEKTELSER